MTTWPPNKGDEVRVCYDGKWGRGTPGTVKTRRGFALQVEYIPWGADDKSAAVSQWFTHIYDEMDNEWYYGGWLRCDNALMPLLFSAPGDWYAVYPKDLIP